MNKYYAMNKVLEENGTCERSMQEEEDFVNSETCMRINDKLDAMEEMFRGSDAWERE